MRTQNDQPKTGETRTLKLAKAGLYLCVCILLLRLILKDRTLLTAVFYYMTPWTLYLLLAGLVSTVLLLNKSRKHGFAAAGCFVAGLLCYLPEGHSGAVPPAAGTDNLKIMYWNAMRTCADEATFREISTHTDRDIIAIVERGRLEGSDFEKYRRHFRDCEIWKAPCGMLLICRGRILSRETVSLDPYATVNLARLEVRGQTVNFALVDVESNPSLSRVHSLDKIYDILKDREKLVIAGDFNTPLDSVFFRKWKETFIHPGIAGDSGFRETWPYGIPLLWIDHIWHSKDLSYSGYRKKFTGLSDHAWLHSELTGH